MRTEKEGEERARTWRHIIGMLKLPTSFLRNVNRICGAYCTNARTTDMMPSVVAHTLRAASLGCSFSPRPTGGLPSLGMPGRVRRRMAVVRMERTKWRSVMPKRPRERRYSGERMMELWRTWPGRRTLRGSKDELEEAVEAELRVRRRRKEGTRDEKVGKGPGGGMDDASRGRERTYFSSLL